jgi:hypothetical protein
MRSFISDTDGKARQTILETDYMDVKTIGRGAYFTINAVTNHNWEHWYADDLKMTCRTSEKGTKMKSRSIVKDPKHGGKDCPALRIAANCNAFGCPVDCTVSEWGSFGSCSKSCGTGSKRKSRSILVDVAHGGKSCPSLSASGTCNAFHCVVDCVISGWTKFSLCSEECGGGVQTKTRSIITPPVDAACPHPLMHNQNCNEHPCPIDCETGEWHAWSACTKTCGEGTRSRTIEVKVKAEHGGYECPSRQTERCSVKPCPIDCKVTGWSEFGWCTKTCGGGTHTKSRSIIVKQESGGLACPKLTVDRSCGEITCPIDCKVSPWSSYSTCSTTCGEVPITDIAHFTFDSKGNFNGAKSHVVAKMYAKEEEHADYIRTYIVGECRVQSYKGNMAWHVSNNNFKDEGHHGCSISTIDMVPIVDPDYVACKFSLSVTDLDYHNVEKEADDKLCFTIFDDKKRLVTERCQVDDIKRRRMIGAAKTTFMKTTSHIPGQNYKLDSGLTGERTASEFIRDLKGNHKTKVLETEWTDVKTIGRGAYFTINAVTNHNWEHWYADDLKMTCKKLSPGQKSKSRSVITEANHGGVACPMLINSANCNAFGCPIDCKLTGWSAVSTCSKSCGSGTKSKTRSIVTNVKHGGTGCSSLKEERPCNTFACPVDCVVSEWSSFGACSKSCGTGTKTKTRSVVTATVHGGMSCPALSASSACATFLCAFNCEMSTWSTFGTCSENCGGGIHSKTRSVIKASIAGGVECESLTREENCNAHPCPVDCDLRDELWSEWGACSKSCGTGIQTRTFDVITAAAHGGIKCPSSEERTCNTTGCPVDCKVTPWSVKSACTKSCGVAVPKFIGSFSSQKQIPIETHSGYATCMMSSPLLSYTHREFQKVCYTLYDTNNKKLAEDCYEKARRLIAGAQAADETAWERVSSSSDLTRAAGLVDVDSETLASTGYSMADQIKALVKKKREADKAEATAEAAGKTSSSGTAAETSEETSEEKAVEEAKAEGTTSEETHEVDEKVEAAGKTTVEEAKAKGTP